ncbi:probable cyclin-dependent serine/threonine-protein kinase DDB_G0292550 [Drosophila serrata]|uniref:probable cyclin-dependent serine/threonine-protein kinase DDB_G0292550 n=1 Tax=Drosophila serrata TaxID=7274 RepID=UPI000A1D1884|nr:probable cyclin-dependent serine/threonine-protein kinase DDB_G0292550 [Drosophila serrata]
MPPNFNNLGANPDGNFNFRAQQSREMPQNQNNQRFNNNRGPNHGQRNNDYMTNLEDNLDGTPMIDQRQDIDDNFLESRDRPHSDYREMQPNLSPQIGRNYQRIVNNNQITLCRQDWIEANRMELDNRNRPNNPNFNDNFRRRQFEDQDQGYNDDQIMEDSDRFRSQQQQDDFGRPGFRGPEDHGIRTSFNEFEGNQGNIIVQRNNNPNYHGRGRNDRNDRRHFNDDNYEIDRAQSNDSVTFRGSNNFDVSAKRYQRRSGSGDRHHSQPANPNQNRSNQGRNAPNPRQTNTSQDQAMARNNYSSGQNQRSTSKASQDRNPKKIPSTGGSRTNEDRIPRSTSLASQNRSTSGGDKPKQDRIAASKSVKPGDANLKKPMQAGQRNLGGVKQNRVSPQTKSNRSASEAKTNCGASKTSTSKEAKYNASAENARVGQKRKVEIKESESNRPSKVDNKRKKMTPSQPEFIIGGISLPYINNNNKKLPQSEDMSYAVTFFEQTPIYNTNIYVLDHGQMDDAHEEESDAESLGSNQSGSKGNKLNSKKILQNKLKNEWLAIYRGITTKTGMRGGRITSGAAPRSTKSWPSSAIALCTIDLFPSIQPRKLWSARSSDAAAMVLRRIRSITLAICAQFL